MDENYEMICFQIIAGSGAAKSNYVEAIQKAKAGQFDEVEKLIQEAEEAFVEVHKIHAQLIQQEAAGNKTEFSLLLMHAEDQMASTEMAKLLCNEIVDLYKKDANK